jgi:hypothetical protein
LIAQETAKVGNNNDPLSLQRARGGPALGGGDGEPQQLHGESVDLDFVHAASGAQRLDDFALEQPHTHTVAGNDDDAQDEQNGDSNNLPAFHKNSGAKAILPAAIARCKLI